MEVVIISGVLIIILIVLIKIIKEISKDIVLGGLEHDEYEITSFTANCNGKGGKVFLTNYRIIFMAHNINFGSKIKVIQFKDIYKDEIQKNRNSVQFKILNSEYVNFNMSKGDADEFHEKLNIILNDIRDKDNLPKISSEKLFNENSNPTQMKSIKKMIVFIFIFVIAACFITSAGSKYKFADNRLEYMGVADLGYGPIVRIRNLTNSDIKVLEIRGNLKDKNYQNYAINFNSIQGEIIPANSDDRITLSYKGYDAVSKVNSVGRLYFTLDYIRYTVNGETFSQNISVSSDGR